MKTCIVETCDGEAPYTWFCPLHYHIKEANYALNDLYDLNRFPEKDRAGWRQRSIDRLEALLAFVKEQA